MAPEFICPTLEVKIGGRTFNLRMDMTALHLAEKLAGCSFLNPDTWDALTVTSVTALLWAAAVQTDKTLTIGDIRGMAPKYLSEVVNACTMAWRAANDVPAEEPRPTNGSLQESVAVPAQ